MPENLSLATMMDGAAVILVDRALADIAANILDPNTDAKAPRSVTLTIKIAPDESREHGKVSASVKASLATHKPLSGVVHVGASQSGRVGLFQFDPRQMGFFQDPENVVMLGGVK